MPDRIENGIAYLNGLKVGDIYGSNYIEISNAGVLSFKGTAHISDDSSTVDVFKKITVTKVTCDNVTSTEGSLKIHNHLMAEGVEYANEFKGEFLSTSGTMDGIAAHYHMSASGTGVMRSILGVAYLDTGITLLGTSAAASWISGILGSVNVAGVLNGTAVTVTGVYGGLGSMTGGTLTACKYMSAIWADSQVTQVPSSGDSQLILMTNGAGGTLGQAMLIDASNRITRLFSFNNCTTGFMGAKVDADIAYAHYRKMACTVDGAAGWILIGLDA
jgi:hypothetical protein